jgi:hypothetical protein
VFLSLPIFWVGQYRMCLYIIKVHNNHSFMCRQRVHSKVWNFELHREREREREKSLTTEYLWWGVGEREKKGIIFQHVLIQYVLYAKICNQLNKTDNSTLNLCSLSWSQYRIAIKFVIWVFHILETVAVSTQVQVTNLCAFRYNLAYRHFCALAGLAKQPRVNEYFMLDGKQWSCLRSYPSLFLILLSYATKSSSNSQNTLKDTLSLVVSPTLRHFIQIVVSSSFYFIIL